MKRLIASVGFVFSLGLGSAAAQGAPTPPKAPEAAKKDKAVSGEALEKAYLKEFAFLKSEKAALQKRLEEVKARADRQRAEARREIDRLEGRVLGLRRTTTETEDRLRDAERNAEQGSRPEVIYETLSRAREPLVSASYEVGPLPLDRGPTAEETVKALDETFTAAAELMRAGAKITKRKGAFFLVDGTRVEGDILRLGQVAAYGVSHRGGGALAPAGANMFRVWPMPAEDTASSLVSGNSPAALRVLLFESTNKAMVAKKEKTPMDEVRAGGVIAYVIVALGVVALFMVLMRLLTLWRVSAGSARLTDRTVALIREGKITTAIPELQAASGPTARLLTVTCKNVRAAHDKLDDVVQEALLNETPLLERFGTAITVFAAVAPLLGLLGTVTGMIATFDVITEFGTGDPRMLSGGISEALITTKLGLVVAIPALLLGTLLSSWSDSIINGMEHATLRVVNAYDGMHRGTGDLEVPRSQQTAESHGS